jgi:L-arabinose isomerase
MNRKPKIGVLFLAGDSWWEAGCCTATQGPYAGFLQKLEGDVRRMLAVLESDYELSGSGLLHTTPDAVAEARRFNAAGVEAIVFCPIIWTNDQPVVAFLQEARKVPLVMWAYNPYPDFPAYFKIAEWVRASAPVSVQQSANILRRFGWEFDVVFGNETEAQTLRDLRAFLRAATVLRGLRGTRIAVLPSPCRVVISTWVDELFLLEKFGVELQYVPVDDYARLVREVKEAEARGYADWLRQSYPVEGVTPEVLLESAKQALAFVRLIKDRGLSGIALEDFNADIYRILGFRPHLVHPAFGEMGCTIGFEADVLGVLSTIIAGRLAGRQAMFNEFFSVDRRANTILMGHPGHGEPQVGEPSTFQVTYDLEFDETQKRGAWLSYRAKPGAMSFLNFTPEYGMLKTSAFTGESLPGPRLMEGYSHMLVRPDCDAVGLFCDISRRGLIQHWGTVHGRIMPELKTFARLAGLDLKAY